MSHANKPGVETKTPLPSEIAYVAKTYTLREQLLFGSKLFAIGALVLLAIWWLEKM